MEEKATLIEQIQRLSNQLLEWFKAQQAPQAKGSKSMDFNKHLYHLKKVIIVEGCDSISDEAYGKEGLLYYCDQDCSWYIFNNVCEGGEPSEFNLRNQGYKYAWTLEDVPEYYLEDGQLKLYYEREGDEVDV